jgi:hypothetical protein
VTGSRWNAYLDRKLELDLTQEENRLADAIARCTLGFNHPTDRLGEDMLRRKARLRDGRSFTRARKGLIEKKLLRYTPPESPGRGHRGEYELLLGKEEERDAGVDETPAAQRDFGGEVPAEETPAVERVRKGVKQKQTSDGK